jgi:hypothetical protein
MSYATFVSLAKRLIQVKGVACSHISRAAGAYAPATGVTITETTQTTYGVFLGGVEKASAADSDTHIIQKFVMSPLNVTIRPKPGDDVLIGTTRYTVVTVDELNPDNGATILWDLTVSSGE